MRRDTMKGRLPWGRLAVLVCVLWILPLVAAAATLPAGSEKAASVELSEPLTRRQRAVHAMAQSARVGNPPGRTIPHAKAWW